MEAVQAMTGQGGWPMTVFLTPDGAPFYCGTYFPPDDRHGMPAFRQCSRQSRTPDATGASEVARAPGTDRAPIRARVEALKRPAAVTRELLDARASRSCAELRRRHGGFGGAPKFPPSMTLRFPAAACRADR